MLGDFHKPEQDKDTTIVHVGDDGDFFELRPTSYQPYKSAVSKFNKRNKVQINKGTISDKVILKAMAKILTEHIIVNWQMTSEKKHVDLIGKLKTKARKGLKEGFFDIPFTKENAERILSHKSCTEMQDFIIRCASDYDAFVTEDKEDDAKN